jgi:hypothetical protein
VRYLLTPSALKTRNLYRKNQAFLDDDDWREPGQIGPYDCAAPRPTGDMVFQEDRGPAFQPIGLLDAHGAPLGRYVIPIQRPIGFGQIHDEDDGADCITYICTEADIRVEQTDAGRTDDAEYQEPEIQE